MEVGRLWYLVEPSCLVLISTATVVVYASGRQALNYERERESQLGFGDGSLTLDGAQAILMPFAFSLSLLLMFYFFASLQQLVTLFTAAAALSSLAFCVSNYVSSVSVAAGISAITGLCWIISGHWILNNVLGISICIAFVAHVRLPNIRVCALLLSCLFAYDIFWVFFSEWIFGTNVMVTVATQQASNPVHTVAQKLSIPIAIAKHLDLPVKLVVPRRIFSNNRTDFMMLGLGDMAIPGMLVALVLCFDHRNSSRKQHHQQCGYTLHAVCGYVFGLVLALGAGLLSQMAQPALLYLVPSTLGPVMVAAWMRGEFGELWAGPRPVLINDKSQLV